MNEKKSTRARGPGRRLADADSREALLAAARTEFAAHGFRGATVRRVAEHAGVTPAMVHYHFRDKRGLYLAMLEATLGPFMRHVQALAESGGTGSLQDALTAYMRLLARTPELPALLIRDVLAADGPMRETFIRDFAARGAGAMRRILERDLAAGTLRDDLDPRLALLSLISLAAFPFVARPVAEQLLALDYDDAMVERLATHTVKLFYEGVCRPEARP